MKGTMVFIVKWLVIAVLRISFQCVVPDPWNQASGRCINQVRAYTSVMLDDEDNRHQFAFWITNGVIDVTTQLQIGLAPIYLLSILHLPAAKKRLSLLSFTPNTTYRTPPNLHAYVLTQPRTIPLAVLRLVYLYKVYHSSDTAMSAVIAALVIVVHTNYCIVASCLPFLKPLIDSLDIGLMTNDIRVLRRSEESTKDKSRINPFAILSRRKRYRTPNAYGWTRFPTSSDYPSTVTAGYGNDFEFQNLERHGSQDRMVINQTKTTVVSVCPKVLRQ